MISVFCVSNLLQNWSQVTQLLGAALVIIKVLNVIVWLNYQ